MTGWLKWTPDVVLNTPIPQLRLAIAGKIDFLKKTNPWGSSDGDADAPQPQQHPDPARAAQQIMAALKSRRPHLRSSRR